MQYYVYIGDLNFGCPTSPFGHDKTVDAR